MKAVAVFLVGLAQFCTAEGQKVGKGADIKGLLENRYFMKQQLSCVVKSGPCNFIGLQMQGAVTEVVSRNCQNCNPQQRATANQVMTFIRNNYPDYYRQIIARYSPQGG
uniref:Chemosensory protein 16 n=1 Tax=Matsumurasca onukii TaxID=2912585 RepID=A0A343WH11_MATON|nr:chemosensory protein 16 [Matsumurasca onukii]